jgi:hypothetical protein
MSTSDQTKRDVPLPNLEVLLVCREIFRDEGGGEILIVGPTTYIPLPVYPAAARLCIYAQLNGGHGSYRLELAVGTPEERLWRWSPHEPLNYNDPLRPYQLVFRNLPLVHVPRPSKLPLALLLNGEEVGQQILDFARG